MKAIVNSSGGPAITAVDDPRPGSGEALVAVQAFSVNHGELDLLRTRTSGWRPGQDVAGVVVAQARDGSGPAAGTRVVALAEQAGWAELAAVPASRLAPLPAEVGTEQAAALPLAGLTALRTLRLAGDWGTVNKVLKALRQFSPAIEFSALRRLYPPDVDVDAIIAET